MAKKGVRDKIKLVSTAETGFYYTTHKNKRNTPGKLEMKKFDPVVRKHVMFKEAKINSVLRPCAKKPAACGLFCGPRRRAARGFAQQSLTSPAPPLLTALAVPLT